MLNTIQRNLLKKYQKKSNNFINDSFNLAFNLIKKEKIKKFINGPISKKNFLGNKYLGVTEYVSKSFSKKTCMLIYNQKLSVCPVTTHLPLKQVSKNINKKNIQEKIKLIN